MLRIPPNFLVDMIADARERSPNEACGLIAGANDIGTKLYRITNVEPNSNRYEMDSHELYVAMREIEENGWDLAAIYHSHPRSDAYPSITDRELAFYSEAVYLIVSLQNDSDPQLRGFKLVDGDVREQPILLVD
jgi:proteasome lid subunit RPN8/RPN11